MKRLLIIFALFFFSSLVASEPTFDVNVSPNTKQVGDIVDYQISLNFDKQFNLIKVPNFIEFSKNKDISIRDTSVTKSENTNNRSVQLNYQFQFFSIEPITIPTQNIVLKTGQQLKTLEIPAQTIIFQSVLDQQSYDIFTNDIFYYNLDLAWEKILFYIIVFLILVGLCILNIQKILANISQKKKQVDNMEPLDLRSAYERSVDDLNQLHNRLDELDNKTYYVQFTNIIKQYLSYLWSENVVEMTTIEIKNMVELRLNTQDARRLMSILTFSDQIKFAKSEPVKQEHVDIFNQALFCLDKIESTVSKLSQKKSVGDRAS